MLAKTPTASSDATALSDDLPDIARFIEAGGGQPPVDVVVREPRRRKPPRQTNVVESILDENGQRVWRMTAAPGFVIDNVIMQEASNTVVIVSPTRGKPRSRRVALAAHVRALNERRRADHPATYVVLDCAKPDGNAPSKVVPDQQHNEPKGSG